MWSSWYKVQRLIRKEQDTRLNESITTLPLELDKKEAFQKAVGLHESNIIKIIQGGEYTISYIVNLCVASIIAGIGLITNNSVVVVASMLVSPLMGPILQMCMCFQIYLNPKTVVNDTFKEGLQRALINEVWSLMLCVMIGISTGLMTILYQSEIQSDEINPMWSPTTHWPTREMISRTSANGLIIGCAIAIPSGIAIGDSFLNNGQTSLVGVAISASLLPPAVNTGILLSYAWMIPTDSFENPDPFDPFHGLDRIEWKSWSEDRNQWYNGALLSFTLTVVNIFCIILTTSMVFYIRGKKVVKRKSEIIKMPFAKNKESI